MPMFLSLTRIVETSIKTLQLFLHAVSLAVGFDLASIVYIAGLESTKCLFHWCLDVASQTFWSPASEGHILPNTYSTQLD